MPQGQEGIITIVETKRSRINAGKLCLPYQHARAMQAGWIFHPLQSRGVAGGGVPEKRAPSLRGGGHDSGRKELGLNSPSSDRAP